MTISEMMMLLAEVTMDGKSSYPSIILPLAAIAAIILAVVVGSKRFATSRTKARVLYWAILAGITIVCLCLWIFAPEMVIRAVMRFID